MSEAEPVSIVGIGAMGTATRSRMLPSLSALTALAHDSGYRRSDIASVTKALLDSSGFAADSSVPDPLRRA